MRRQRTIQKQIGATKVIQKIEFVYGIPDEGEKKILKKLHKEITKIIPKEVNPYTLNTFVLQLSRIVKRYKVPRFYYAIIGSNNDLSQIQNDTLAWLNAVGTYSEIIKEKMVKTIEKKPNKNAIAFFNYLQFIRELSNNMSIKVLSSKKINPLEFLILFILSVKLEMFLSQKVDLKELIDNLDSARALSGG